MNVSKGDLALVIRGDFKGATCTVGEPDGWYRVIPSGERVFMWNVTMARPMAWRYGPTRNPGVDGVLPDVDLRRLTGPDVDVGVDLEAVDDKFKAWAMQDRGVATS